MCFYGKISIDIGLSKMVGGASNVRNITGRNKQVIVINSESAKVDKSNHVIININLQTLAKLVQRVQHF